MSSLRAWLLTTLALACASAHADTGFSAAALDALLAESPRTHRPIARIEELVPLLPDELRENFTFVYESRSPFARSISTRYPRVILFSNDARLILSFTGDPTKPGHDVLETLRFDDTQSAFVTGWRPLPAAESNEAPVCARCHGDDPRPIYDAYPLWPGFYGSALDTFPRAPKTARREAEAYRDFLRHSARSGVYAGLRWVLGSPMSPYLDPRRDDVHRTSAAPEALYYQPNTRLGMALTELNRQRIQHKLETAPGYAAALPALLRDLLGCDEERTREGEDVIAKALRAESDARLRRWGADPKNPAAQRFAMQELNDVHALAQIDALAHRLHLDRADWSMALEPSAFAFFDGVLGASVEGHSYYLVEDFLVGLLASAARVDPRLTAFIRPRNVLSAVDLPFGHKLDLALARSVCAQLPRR